MKSKLILTPTADMTRAQWLGFRHQGVGASDVGTLMGLNPYKSTIQLFYEKIGQPVESLETLAMFMGSEQEAFIGELWEYWDPKIATDGAMMDNFRKGNKVRRCQRVRAYIQNPDYPWLFVSLDRKINKYDHRGEGALEIKRIGGWESDKWESGIVPSHVVQVQTQIMVAEFLFGEMAVLKDGPDFSVYPFEIEVKIQEAIKELTRRFWDKVVEARKLLTKKFHSQQTFNMKAVQEAEAALQRLEPEPDGSMAYDNFLKKKFKIAEEGIIKGTEKDMVNARGHLKALAGIKVLEAEKMLFETKLKQRLRDEATTLDFGMNGKVTWKNSGDSRRFINKVSPD